MKEKFVQEDRQEYTDVSTVESQRNDITLEEFPEGPTAHPCYLNLLARAPRGGWIKEPHTVSIMRIMSCMRERYGIIRVRMFLMKRYQMTCMNLSILEKWNDVSSYLKQASTINSLRRKYSARRLFWFYLFSYNWL